MQYKSVVATSRGGPETLQIVQNDLRPPAPGEARVKILAVPVCQDDIAARIGNRPFLPKLPFVPGYSFLGVVDAIGERVGNVSVGDRVAALTRLGGYAEYIYCAAEKLVLVPKNLDPAQAVVLMLNYLVAYQVLHREARVKAGDSAAIIGASGGVGTAFLQLGRLAGVNMYGLSSPAKHDVVTAHGATPIDYHSQDFVDVIRRIEPEGIDFVFNGMGDEYFARGLAVLKRGGALVAYGAPQSFLRFLLLVAKLLYYNTLPNKKSIKGYGTHRGDVEQYKQDWTTLFRLLDEGKIAPVIAERFPILEAAQANRLLESGGVTGNIVLLSPELL